MKNKLIFKKLNNILNTIIGSFVGVFIGHSIYRYLDYRNNPHFYEIQSSPWYTSIQVYALATGIVILIAIITKLLIKYKIESA